MPSKTLFRIISTIGRPSISLVGTRSSKTNSAHDSNLFWLQDRWHFRNIPDLSGHRASAVRDCQVMRFDERNGSSVLERAFNLLGALESSGADLPLADLSRRAGLPKPTAYRLASQLVSLGVLTQSPGGYSLGPRMFDFGNAVFTYRKFRELAMPFMGDLYEATRQIVNLGTREGLTVLYLEKLTSHKPSPVETAIGSRKPLYCTALGKAMLAFSPKEVVEATVSDGLRPYTPRTLSAPNLLAEELRQIRKNGYAFDREEYSLGTMCVAAPLRGRDGVAFGAISVTGRADSWDLTRYAAATRATALALNRSVLQADSADIAKQLRARQ